MNTPSAANLRVLFGAPGIGKGVAFLATSAFAVTWVNVIVRLVSGEVHPFEAAFFRSAFSVLLFLPLVIRSPAGALRTRRLPLLTARSLLEAFSALLFFLALTMAPLAQLTVIGFCSPLFATVLAVLFLGEPIRARRVAALLFGFAGVLVVLRPIGMEVSLGPMLAVCTAATWATAMAVTKSLSRTETSLAIAFYSALITVPVALAAALPFWTWPDLESLAWLLGLGFASSVRQWTLSQAFRVADATAILPADFSKLIWASLLGYLLFAEVPDAFTWTGGAMIAGSVMYIALRERAQRAAQRTADRPVA